jgi:hypothetical protein
VQLQNILSSRCIIYLCFHHSLRTLTLWVPLHWMLNVLPSAKCSIHNTLRKHPLTIDMKVTHLFANRHSLSFWFIRPNVMLLEVECFTVDDFDNFHWLFHIEVFIYASGSQNIYATSQNLMSTKETSAVLYIPLHFNTWSRRIMELSKYTLEKGMSTLYFDSWLLAKKKKRHTLTLTMTNNY